MSDPFPSSAVVLRSGTPNLYRALMLLLAFGIGFKSILVYLGGEMIVYALSILFLFLTLIHFLKESPGVTRHFAYVLPFLMWGFLSVLLYAFSQNWMVGIVGFGGTYLYFMLWLSAFLSIDSSRQQALIETYTKIHLAAATVLALFAIYQSTSDYSLFGVNPYQKYGLAGEAVFEQFTSLKRATSFIGSPQNLGFYMAVSCGTIMLSDLPRNLKTFLWIIFLMAGFLSFSAAFFFGFVILVGVYYLQTVKGFLLSLFKYLIPILIVFTVLPLLMSEDTHKFMGGIFYFDLFSDRSEDWLHFMRFDGVLPFLAGHGIGMTDRIVEEWFNKIPPQEWRPGMESYLVKLFYEMGFVGFVSFALLYTKALTKSYRSGTRRDRILFALLLSVLANIAVTPSFTGFTMSFVVWPFILYPLLGISASSGAAQLGSQLQEPC